VKHEDFLKFVAGASSPKTRDVKERAMAWLLRQGITGPIDELSPEEVSRLSAAAQNVIAARLNRERRAIPRVESPEPTNNDVPWQAECSRFRSARCAIAAVPGMCASSTPENILTQYGGVFLLHRFFHRVRLRRHFYDSVRFPQRNNAY